MTENQNTTDRRAFLGMPGYGLMTAAASRGLWLSSSGENLKVDVCYRQGPLLAQVFNGLWCEALTKKVRGAKLDYFAMLHSDVGPELYWLDKLIAEMEDHDLDVLGVVVPIKTPHGVTSIALDNPDRGESLLPLCRLTMEEVFRLPPTFTAKDVGHPLLLNTGCWVCRFDMKWAPKFYFTINDAIRYDRERNLFIADVEPEDWNASRTFNEMGLKIGATRKIQLEHEGPAKFTNTHPWGSDYFDFDYIKASVIPQSRIEGFQFPHDVEGWLLPAEGEALAELARGKTVLEVGSYCGKSTICMGQTAKVVFALDTFDGRGTPRPRDTLHDLCKNLDRYGLRAIGSPKVQPLVGTLADRPDDWGWNGPQFDLIFIDGAHDYESVKSDLDNALPLLNPGGLIVFHDYRQFPGQHDGRWDPDVTKAVNEFLSAGAELVSTHESLAVVRPPAAIPLEV